jgi:hypothetical protein
MRAEATVQLDVHLLDPNGKGRRWTDDFSNVLSALGGPSTTSPRQRAGRSSDGEGFER